MIRVPRGLVRRSSLVALAIWLAACGSDAAVPEATSSPSSPETRAPSPVSEAPHLGEVVAAPHSSSAVYPPNPGAIVVAIDAGHGGCLDWGVPDPSERGVELAEKTLTLAIARELEGLLRAEGIGVVMIRDEDEALAGDRYPPLGCEGPPFRDVNGDGMAGFGDETLPEATRTRDELQARLDLANLAQADALVSIHINSPTEGGQRIEVAFTETFYTDETRWGASVTAPLAEAVQGGVVDQLATVATYERGDRGTTAHNFYLVAPPLLEETEERPNRWAQPTRGGLMPVVLSEVGSITLRQEHDLLASAEGTRAAAAGLLDGLAAFIGERRLAGRITPADSAGWVPEAAEGDGPPFWPQPVPAGPLTVEITNTGTSVWPAGGDVVVGWGETDQPYLAIPPPALVPLGLRLPSLRPGESVTVDVDLPPGPASRAVAWISLMIEGETLGDHGSPSLQLSSGAP